jgi:hypothetical protein
MMEGNEPQSLYFTVAPDAARPRGAVLPSIGALSGTLTEKVGRLTGLGVNLLG